MIIDIGFNIDSNCMDLLVDDFLPTKNDSIYLIKLSVSHTIKWRKYLNIDNYKILNNYDSNHKNDLSFNIEPYSFIGAMIRIDDNYENNNRYSVNIGKNKFLIDELLDVLGWSALQIKNLMRAYCFIKTDIEFYLYIWNTKSLKLMNKIDLLSFNNYQERNNPFLAIQLREIDGIIDYYDSMDTNDIKIYENSNIISLKTIDRYKDLLDDYNQFFGNEIFFLLQDTHSIPIQFIGFDSYIHHLSQKNIYRWININDYNINYGQQDIKLFIGQYEENGEINHKKIKIEIDHICDDQFIKTQAIKQQNLSTIKWFIYSLLLFFATIIFLGVLYFSLFSKIKPTKIH